MTRPYGHTDTMTVIRPRRVRRTSVHPSHPRSGSPGWPTRAPFKSRLRPISGNDRNGPQKPGKRFGNSTQRDMAAAPARLVLSDQTVTVTRNRAVTVSKGNDALTVLEGDRVRQQSKETHSVQGTRYLTVTGAETHGNKADFTQTVSGNFVLTVDGDITIKASGAVALQSGTGMTVSVLHGARLRLTA